MHLSPAVHYSVYIMITLMFVMFNLKPNLISKEAFPGLNIWLKKQNIWLWCSPLRYIEQYTNTQTKRSKEWQGEASEIQKLKAIQWKGYGYNFIPLQNDMSTLNNWEFRKHYDMPNQNLGWLFITLLKSNGEWKRRASLSQETGFRNIRVRVS